MKDFQGRAIQKRDIVLVAHRFSSQIQLVKREVVGETESGRPILYNEANKRMIPYAGCSAAIGIIS